MTIVEKLIGPINSDNFRIGASSLADNIIKDLTALENNK